MPSHPVKHEAANAAIIKSVIIFFMKILLSEFPSSSAMSFAGRRGVRTAARRAVVFRFFCTCDSVVQEQITAFCNIQTAVLHIVACRCLKANRLELGFHIPNNNDGQAYTHRNRNRDPNQRKRLFGQIMRIVGIAGSCLGDEIVAKPGEFVKGF